MAFILSGVVLACLGVLCIRKPALLLERSPAKRHDPTWDEARMRRFLKWSGWISASLGALLLALGIISLTRLS